MMWMMDGNDGYLNYCVGKTDFYMHHLSSIAIAVTVSSGNNFRVGCPNPFSNTGLELTRSSAYADKPARRTVRYIQSTFRIHYIFHNYQ